jgi:hypothetical protein
MWRQVSFRSSGHRTVVLGGLALASCLGGATQGPGSAPGPWEGPMETAILHVEARHEAPVSVDPRPIAVRIEPLFPSSADYLSVPDSLVRARGDVVRAAGLLVSSAFPLLPECSVANAPPALRQTSGCPAEPMVRVVFDQPVKSGSTWRVRRIEVWYRSTGVTVTSLELELKAVNDAWMVSSDRAIVSWT